MIYLDKLSYVNIVFDVSLALHTNPLVKSHLAFINCVP